MSAYIHAPISPHSGNTFVLSTGLLVLSLLLWYSGEEQLYEILSYARYAVICNSSCHKHCFLVFFYFKLALPLVRNSASLQCDIPAWKELPFIHTLFFTWDHFTSFFHLLRGLTWNRKNSCSVLFLLFSFPYSLPLISLYFLVLAMEFCSTLVH